MHRNGVNEVNLYLFAEPWTRVAASLPGTRAALLPMGAVEAHGPHLPLSTDIIIAEGMAAAGAEALARRGVGSLVLPPVPFAVTYASSVFPGTVGLTPGTLAAVVVDVARSLARHGTRCLCLCNAHLEPIHVETLQRAAAAAEWEAPLAVGVVDLREERWAARLSEEFRRGARHAGSYETALVMALRPDLVRDEERRRLEPLWIDLPARLRAGARTFRDAGSELAYFGDPASATVEEGRELLAALGEIVADAVEELLQRAPR